MTSGMRYYPATGKRFRRMLVEHHLTEELLVGLMAEYFLSQWGGADDTEVEPPSSRAKAEEWIRSHLYAHGHPEVTPGPNYDAAHDADARAADQWARPVAARLWPEIVTAQQS